MDCFVAEFIIGPAEGRTRWLLGRKWKPHRTPIASITTLSSIRVGPKASTQLAMTL
jgi:hypothetical protein